SKAAAVAECAMQAQTATTSTSMSRFAIPSVAFRRRPVTPTPTDRSGLFPRVGVERSELLLDVLNRTVDEQGAITIAAPEISEQRDVVARRYPEHRRSAVTASD